MARLNLVERRLERFVREPPSVRNAVIATLVVVVGAGLLMIVIDGGARGPGVMSAA